MDKNMGDSNQQLLVEKWLLKVAFCGFKNNSFGIKATCYES